SRRWRYAGQGVDHPWYCCRHARDYADQEKVRPATARQFLSRLFAHHRPTCILNHMVQHSNASLDASFAALSDATRRAVLQQLGRADASITDLADKFHMTLTGMKKHVGVLEQAGLGTTEKVGRVADAKRRRGALEGAA